MGEIALTLKTGADHVRPTAPIATNADYLAFVLGDVLAQALPSYRQQFGVETDEDGVTAAREAFNASLPPEEPAEEGGDA